MKKKLLVLILIIGFILTGCSRSSEKITAREQRKVDKYLAGYNSSVEGKGLLKAKFEKKSKSVIIVMGKDAYITDADIIRNSTDNMSKDFVELIGDYFTIRLVNNAEDFIIYEVKDGKVILDRFDEYLEKDSINKTEQNKVKKDKDITENTLEKNEVKETVPVKNKTASDTVFEQNDNIYKIKDYKFVNSKDGNNKIIIITMDYTNLSDKARIPSSYFSVTAKQETDITVEMLKWGKIHLPEEHKTDAINMFSKEIKPNITVEVSQAYVLLNSNNIILSDIWNSGENFYKEIVVE